jgi:hypothetical protein
LGVHYVAANLHRAHDTIATFHHANPTDIRTIFLQARLLGREVAFCGSGRWRSTAPSPAPAP